VALVKEPPWGGADRTEACKHALPFCVPQKYGGASAATIPDFMMEIQAMMDTTHNHPAVVQYTVFNEGDCIGVFNNVSEIVSWVQVCALGFDIDTHTHTHTQQTHTRVREHVLE
jgi:hypothetical protein